MFKSFPQHSNWKGSVCKLCDRSAPVFILGMVTAALGKSVVLFHLNKYYNCRYYNYTSSFASFFIICVHGCKYEITNVYMIDPNLKEAFGVVW